LPAVNWRAAGCLTAIFGSFLLVGLFGMYLAFSEQSGCSAVLQWSDRVYRATGTPAPSPAFETDGEPVNIGSTFAGLTTRTVYGPPGSVRSASAADRPETVAMDCGDDSFQTYAWDGLTRTPLPGASGGG
jgi:hypothetical protein